MLAYVRHVTRVFLIRDGKPHFDYDLESLRELTLVLDARLDSIERSIQKYSDADMFGDSAEAVCGLGFVACQQYLAATASWLGVEKTPALQCSPNHVCGDTIVSIVNHAANYWKHGDEWLLGKTEKQQAKTQDGLVVLSHLSDELGTPSTRAGIEPIWANRSVSSRRWQALQ